MYCFKNVICEGKHLYATWKGNTACIPEGTTYGCSDNGWITSKIFLDWLKFFIKEVKQRPLILLCDGHRSHVTLEVILLAHQNDVTIVKFPSHTTHLLQPLDVAVFKGLKIAWDKALIAHQRANGYRVVSKAESVNILCSVWQAGMSQENIIAGFEKTGIFPVCHEKYPVDKFDRLQLQSYNLQITEAGPAQQQILAQIPPPPPQHTPPHQLPPPPQLTTPMEVHASHQVPSSSQLASPASSTASTSLHQFFMDNFSRSRCATSTPQSELAMKRQRIQQNAAVITHKDYTDALMDIQNLSSQKAAKGKTSKPPKPVSSDSSSGDESEDENRDPQAVPHAVSPELITPNAYVVVCFVPTKHNSHPVYYVASVIRQFGNLWEIQCMRRQGTSGNKYAFVSEDFSNCESSDIMQILHAPKMVRCVYHFDIDDFSLYEGYMR